MSLHAFASAPSDDDVCAASETKARVMASSADATDFAPSHAWASQSVEVYRGSVAATAVATALLAPIRIFNPKYAAVWVIMPRTAGV